MRPDATPALLRLCRSPGSAPGLGAADWNRALRSARREGLLARLGWRIEDAGVLADCPEEARELLLAARPYPRYLQTQVARELKLVARTLAPLGTDLILLKGAAYLALGLPLSRGRQLRDLDLLVPRARIASVESRLVAQGWESQVEGDYDQRYYRTWMHEIPPLRHPERSLEVDVHHSVLPLTSRLKPDPGLFWADSVPVPGMAGVRGPADLVLHSATHLFYDGEIRGGLGDLWDLDGLLRPWGTQAAPWEALLERARETGLGRPLRYALALSQRLMGTPIPESVLAAARARFAAPPPIDRLMLGLAARVLRPGDEEPNRTPLADWLLYVRSHWLRMPPQLLFPHLARKALGRLPWRS
jgi:hypothetical protein